MPGSPRPGPPLNDQGRAQAAAAAVLVDRVGRDLWGDIPYPSELIASPMVRTQQTAAAVCCVRTIGEAISSLGYGMSPHRSRPTRSTSTAAAAACARPWSLSGGPGTDEPEYPRESVNAVDPWRTRTTVTGSAVSNRTAAPDGRAARSRAPPAAGETPAAVIRRRPHRARGSAPSPRRTRSPRAAAP